MPMFGFFMQHKKQTKLNDCWYACTQMLKTAANREKTKPTGDHTRRLHSGLFGHKLHANRVDSKHFVHVLNENGLICIPREELWLIDPNKTLIALKKYGPIMIGGEFYSIAGMDFGHYMILAAVDTNAETYLIYDPAKKSPEWISASLLHRKWWGVTSGDSAFAVDPANGVDWTGSQDAEVVSRYPRR